MNTDLESLKSIDYFEGLDPSELESIKGYITEKSVEKGEIFLRQGQTSDYLYFVTAGLVKVFKTSRNGKEQILHIAPPGDSLNDVSTFDGAPSAASMLAMTPVHLYAIRKEDLNTILGNPPKLYRNIFKALAKRVRRDSNLVEELSFSQVLARLAKLLLGTYAGEESTVGLNLNQQEMAAMIGSTREGVNRSLKIMEEAGAIRLSRHRVVVLNKKTLTELVRDAEDATLK
jgi:CRP/FNR family transcriptional regulator, cyclic AMP receptor protein